jgi:glucosylceramidase
MAAHAAVLSVVMVGFSARVAPSVAAQPVGAPVVVSVVQTDPLLQQRMTALAPLALTPTPPPAGTPLVSIDESQRFQRITGFGAAMTDSSAWLLERTISSSVRAATMSALFSPNGLHLTLVRIPIGGSDFTATGRPYTYDDLRPGRSDPTLSHFSIAHDEAYILPALRQVRQLDRATKFLATPWSVPGWMKLNDALSNLRGGGGVRTNDYGPLAAYFVKFIQAYAKAGIPIWALTPSNEPGNPVWYPGMNLPAAAESTLIAQDLVPALARAHLHPQLYGNDLGWYAATYAQQIVSGTAAADLTGIAWHCYAGSPDVMSVTHDLDPRLGALVTECSPGIIALPIPEVVISSLRNWASGVALWNIALDQAGGPVQPPDSGCRGCIGLLSVDTQTHAVTRLNPYYQLGQASSFIEPGAVRVASNTFVAYDYVQPKTNFISAGLDDVAAVNPDGSRVLIAYNNSSAPIPFAIAWEGLYGDYTIPPGAITTFEWYSPGA